MGNGWDLLIKLKEDLEKLAAKADAEGFHAEAKAIRRKLEFHDKCQQEFGAVIEDIGQLAACQPSTPPDIKPTIEQLGKTLAVASFLADLN